MSTDNSRNEIGGGDPNRNASGNVNQSCDMVIGEDMSMNRIIDFLKD